MTGWCVEGANPAVVCYFATVTTQSVPATSKIRQVLASSGDEDNLFRSAMHRIVKEQHAKLCSPR